MEDFDKLPMYEQRGWAQVEILAQLDNWQYEEECAAYFHCRRVTESLYRQYLKIRFPELFRLAGYGV